MIFVYILTLFIGVFCHTQKFASTQTIIPDYASEIKSKSKFSKVLNSIANINEERLNALKRYAALDTYNAASGILRIADDKQRDPMVAVMLINKENSEDNKLFEIFDSEDVNTYGNTPVRNIIHRVKEYYNTGKDNEESDTTSSSKTLSSQNEDNLPDILHDFKHRLNIERGRKESSDGEEINLKAKKKIKDGDIKESSDGEEINQTSTITKKAELDEIEDGEVIINNTNELTVKQAMKTTIQNDTKSNSKIKTIKDHSDGEELIVHGKQIVKLSDIRKDKKNILRLFKKCNKEAIRRCKKACKKASKANCEIYKCSKGMKRTAKKNCKQQCKDYFSDI